MTYMCMHNSLHVHVHAKKNALSASGRGLSILEIIRLHIPTRATV